MVGTDPLEVDWLLVGGELRCPDCVGERQGLPNIPTNTLSARLRELEATGIVRRRVLPRPASAVIYELTEYGHDLESTILALGRWGSRRLGAQGEDEVVTRNSLVMALRSAFDPAAAAGRDAGFEVTRSQLTLSLEVADGDLTIGAGRLTDFDPRHDLRIEVLRELRPLLTGQVTAQEALDQELVTVSGRTENLALFTQFFHLPEPADPPTIDPDDLELAAAESFAVVTAKAM